MQEILSFANVSYAYEHGRDALKDCSVAIGTGEKIAVLGSNGAGKSTFFLLCNGVLHPQQGQVLLGGKPVRAVAKELHELRKRVGLVFQDPDVQLLGGTVEAEISFGPMNLQLPDAEVRSRVDSAVAALGLEQHRQRAPQYLSGGEKKRVSIADVLAMEPELMLLDEPSAGLDPAGRRLLEQNLAMLAAEGISLMVATHDVDFAWRWAQRVLVFCAGSLVADAAPQTVFADRELLDRCGLEQPVLYRLGEALGLASLPHTPEQLVASLPK